METPEAALSRLDFVNILVEATGEALPDAEATDKLLKEAGLADEESLANAGPNARAAAALALQKGWLLPNYNDDGDPVFQADAPISRGEVLKRLYWVLVWEPQVLGVRTVQEGS